MGSSISKAMSQAASEWEMATLSMYLQYFLRGLYFATDWCGDPLVYFVVNTKRYPLNISCDQHGNMESHTG